MEAINAATVIQAAPAAASALAGGFDIDTLEDLLEAEVELKRDGKGLGIFVTLAGPEHPTRKGFAFAKQRKARAAILATGKLEASDPEEDEREETDLLARCIHGWRGVLKGGQPLACTPENVRAVLSDPKRAWFRAAVAEAFASREAFIKTSATA